MKRILTLGTLMMVAPVLLLVARAVPGTGGTEPADGQYKVLSLISHGNLTIFPVVAAKVHDTSDFLTLDEGIRSGEVVVTEVGKMHTMIRRPQSYRPPAGAQVNTLVLVNNSKRPLILLAGEIVTGGKQDRVVGKDRIIAPESDPVDLSVFCVEPGRWVETAGKFDTHGGVIAQPSVRKRVMDDKDQQKVWAEVQNQNRNITAAAVMAAPPPAAGPQTGSAGLAANQAPSSATETVEVTASAPTVDTVQLAEASPGILLRSTTSYAQVRENKEVEKQVQSIADPVEKSFESVIKQLRDQNAVGVVVAVKGKIIWADIFASKELLSKYWPKLLQSYAAEAFSATGNSGGDDLKSAQEFVDNWTARHEVVESEPGLYRQTEMTGDRFRAFELTSLLPKQIFDLHVSKMAE